MQQDSFDIMNISELITDAVPCKNDLPNIITFDITDRCQMQCVTCTKWNTPNSAKNLELITQEWQDLILKLKNWLGKFTFIFSGGEPFLRQDIFELADYAASLGLSVTVVSNGFLLNNLAEKIIESSISSLIISLNALDPQKHDTTRGVKGSFDRAVEALETINCLKKETGKNLKLNISTILMPQNLDEVIPLVNWATSQGLDGISLQLQEDDRSFHSYHSTSEINTVNYSEKRTLLEEFECVKAKGIEVINSVIQKKYNGAPVRNSFTHLEAMKIFLNNSKDIMSIKCLVGNRNFSVDPYGNIRLCYNMAPVGIIKDNSPEEIWHSKASVKQREIIKNCKMYCRLANCNFKKDNQLK